MGNLTGKFLRNISVLMVLSSLQNLVYSQNIISDVGGGGSLFLNPGFKETKKGLAENGRRIQDSSFNLGIVKFTTAEKKLELNYYSYFSPEKLENDFFIGVSGSGEVKNSIASLFSTGNVAPGADANLRLGFQLWKNERNWKSVDHLNDPDVLQNKFNNTRPASDLWFIASGVYNGSSFKHFRPDSVFSRQVEKIGFTGAELHAGLNYWNARVLKSTLLVGTTIGIKRTNNFDDLDESVQEDTRIITDTVTQTTRKVVSKQTVYSGEYKETTVYPFSVDLYFVPHGLENLAFLLYGRTDISETEKPKTKIGFGIFFLQNQNAFNPFGGLTVDYADAFNVDPSDDSKSPLSKIRIGITTRINLVNLRSRR